MLKVGLTGGIASGKSAVGEMFVALGAHLIQADSIAHQLMHPGQPVYDEIVWMGEIGRLHPRAVAIVEAALIIEAGAGQRFDRLIVVTCRDEQRVKRFAARHHLSREAARQEVTRRMAAQLSDQEKIKAGDYVIDNAGSLDGTRAQVHAVWQQLEAQNPR